MTAARVLPRAARARGGAWGLLAGAAVLVVALGAAVVVGTWAIPVIVGLGAAVILGLILCRLDLAVAVLAADFFFTAYLVRGAGILTIDKGVGALAATAWGLEWAVNRRPVGGTRQLWLLCGVLL